MRGTAKMTLVLFCPFLFFFLFYFDLEPLGVAMTAGGGTGDWRDEWAARGITEMAQATSVTVGRASARRGPADGDDDGSVGLSAVGQTPWVAPGFRRPPWPHQHY